MWSSFNKYIPETPRFEGKHASFKNTKFPRGKCQTDSSETLFVFIVHHLIFFRAPIQKSYWIMFNFFRRKPWKPNVKFEKKADKNPLNTISISICETFYGRLLSIRVFSSDRHCELIASLCGRTLSHHDSEKIKWWTITSFKRWLFSVVILNFSVTKTS